MVPRMAAWSHRIDTLIWAALCFSFIGWLTALVGVTTSQRELHGQDDDNGRTFEVEALHLFSISTSRIAYRADLVDQTSARLGAFGP